GAARVVRTGMLCSRLVSGAGFFRRAISCEVADIGPPPIQALNRGGGADRGGAGLAARQESFPMHGRRLAFDAVSFDFQTSADICRGGKPLPRHPREKSSGLARTQ